MIRIIVTLSKLSRALGIADEEVIIVIMEPAKIADIELTDPVTKEVTTFTKLWKDQTCVIIFLRRFG